MANTTDSAYFAVVSNNIYEAEEDFSEYDAWVSSSQKEFEKALEEKTHIVCIAINSLVFLLGVAGNGCVIFITGFRMKKTVNTIWILNLAITDFAFVFVLIFQIASLALDSHWPFDLVMCKLLSAINILNLYVSVYLLMVISVDRCILVRYPVWAQNHRTPRLASFVVWGVWILALVLCSPYIHVRAIREVQSKTKCYLNFHDEPEKKKIIHWILVIFQLVFSFIIPFGVIIFSYAAVIAKLRRSRLTPSNRPFKVITAVIVAFFVCWFPHQIMLFLEIKAGEDPNLRLTTTIGIQLTSSLAYFNSCLNPILYVFMGLNFKEKLRCSLFSALVNTFTEDSSPSTAHTKVSVSVEMESQNVCLPLTPSSHSLDSPEVPKENSWRSMDSEIEPQCAFTHE